jgi:hypothetical protein
LRVRRRQRADFQPLLELTCHERHDGVARAAGKPRAVRKNMDAARRGGSCHGGHFSGLPPATQWKSAATEL